MLIFAAISLAIGILTLMNKSIFQDNEHLAIGIFMLGEAVLDLVTYFLISRGLKKQNAPAEADTPALEAAPVAAPVPAPAAPVVSAAPEEEADSEENV